MPARGLCTRDMLSVGARQNQAESPRRARHLAGGGVEAVEEVGGGEPPGNQRTGAASGFGRRVCVRTMDEPVGGRSSKARRAAVYLGPVDPPGPNPHSRLSRMIVPRDDTSRGELYGSLVVAIVYAAMFGGRHGD